MEEITEKLAQFNGWLTNFHSLQISPEFSIAKKQELAQNLMKDSNTIEQHFGGLCSGNIASEHQHFCILFDQFLDRKELLQEWINNNSISYQTAPAAGGSRKYKGGEIPPRKNMNNTNPTGAPTVSQNNLQVNNNQQALNTTPNLMEPLASSAFNAEDDPDEAIDTFLESFQETKTDLNSSNNPQMKRIMAMLIKDDWNTVYDKHKNYINSHNQNSKVVEFRAALDYANQFTPAQPNTEEPHRGNRAFQYLMSAYGTNSNSNNEQEGGKKKKTRKVKKNKRKSRKH